MKRNWIARDRSGELRIYNSKPIKNERLGIWQSEDGSEYGERISDNIIRSHFNIESLEWKDIEPKEIKVS